jgi:hypothetical protein
MAMDETTKLLAKPVADSGGCPEACNGKVGTAHSGQKTELWQVGALFGK